MPKQGKITMLQRLIIIVTAAIFFSSSLTLAETKKPKPPDKFPPSPLEIIKPDPLLPRSPKDKQPLTLPEQRWMS
jgi:hypothetical protein